MRDNTIATGSGGTFVQFESPPGRDTLIAESKSRIQELVTQAQAALAAGHIDDAEKLLHRAEPFDGTGQRVKPLLDQIAVERRQQDALQRAETLAAARQPDAAMKLVTDALKDNRRHPGLVALQHRLDADLRQQQVRAAERGLAETRPISLDFRDANLRAVLDAVTRNSGVNFVLDKDVRSDIRVTVYAKSVQVDDALNMILSAQQLARKILDDRTVLIYPNTADKQREHQEQVVKVFYLANGDPKGAAAFLKSMVKLHEPYVDEKNNLLSLRDSLENVQLAERLLAMFDHPEPEVLIDAEVLEVNVDRLTELGVSLPTQVSLTPIAPAGGLTLNSFPLHASGIGVGVSGVAINLNRTTGDVNTLANPRIRARSHEKAKVLIGDRIPIITTTTTPGVAGFVSESVNYQDVGIKLEVEPVVYPDDDVAIRLNLEVSSLGAQVKTASGTVAYQICTRDASTLLRLHDGETQLLAGLISRSDRSSAAGLPGLTDLPILGRLFSDQTDSHSKTELVLAITPHLIRAQPHPDAAMSEAWVGTEASPKLKPVGGRYDAVAARPAAGTPAPASTPASANVQGAGVAPATDAAPPARVTAGEAPVLRWEGPPTVRPGQVFEVDLQLRSGQALGAFTANVRYPNEQLGLVAVVASPDLPDVAAAGDPSVRAEPGGTGVIALPRLVPNAPTTVMSVVRLQFKALKEGDAAIQVSLEAADVASPKVGVPPPFVAKVAP